MLYANESKIRQKFPWLVHGSLEHLARLFDDDSPTVRVDWLWVDSICIDQLNNLERSSQVQRMKDIYEHAMNTVVWLGPSDETSDMALRAIRKLMPCVDHLCRTRSFPDFRPLSANEVKELIRFIKR